MSKSSRHLADRAAALLRNDPYNSTHGVQVRP
jgi:hypothetical protein